MDETGIQTYFQKNEYENKGYQRDEEQETTNGKYYCGKNAKNAYFNESNAQEKLSTTSMQKAKDEWRGGLEFLMACTATSVGLGNVWRFPFTAYENGGGAFLIPYLIILFVIGKPFYYLEGMLGQFTNKSCANTWMMVPAMKGLGYSQIFAAFAVLSYYCSLMALTLYYFLASFQSVLPWSYCHEEWRNICLEMKNTTNEELTPGNTSFSHAISSAELYFRRIVLNELDSIDDGIGTPSWSLALCLLFSWLVIFCIMSRGVKNSGKAAYFLAIFPYIVMFTLLIRAVTLDGAIDGILFFITPKWDVILRPKVWYAAITQCFFSLSVCFGSIITYSSHNNFAHQVGRDVLIVTSLDTFTSLLAGCTIFGILGNLAHEMNVKDISKVVRGGTGLAFISYPDALSRFMIVPQFFSAIFFFMMFVLGTGSAMALFGAINDVLKDNFPSMQQWKHSLSLAVLGYTVGILYITQGGQWFITLVDYYGGTFVAIIVGVSEMITVFWIYGLYNFLNDVEFMLVTRPNFYWRLCWLIITPVLMIVILMYTIIAYEPPTYNNRSFPSYAYAIGWTILAVGIFPIFYWILYEVIRNKKASFFSAIKASFSPSATEWGPKDIKIRTQWKEFISERNFKRQKSLSEIFFK